MWIKGLVIFFIIAEYIFDLYLNIRQWKRFHVKTLPEELKSIESQEEFEKSQNYGLDKISFSMVKNYLSVMQKIIILYFNILPYVWDLCSDILLYYGIEGEIFQALLFTYILSIHGIIDELPFSLYSIFVIEEKHGFNKTTLSEFVKDLFKNLFLTIVITAMILPVLLWIIDWGGEYFYLYICGFLTFVILVISHVYHDLIAPLFNKFTELEDGSLKDSINGLAKQLKFPLKNIYVIDGDRRTDHSNAYFFGFWKNKRIVLYNTLLKKEKNISENEILAILAHELGHWSHNHFIKGLFITELNILVFFYIFAIFLNSDAIYPYFGFVKRNSFIGLILFSYIWSPVSVIIQILMTYRSRYQEFQADEYAKKNDFGGILKSSLIKIHAQNSGNVYPDPLYSAINFSHPPLLERLKAL